MELTTWQLVQMAVLVATALAAASWISYRNRYFAIAGAEVEVAEAEVEVAEAEVEVAEVVRMSAEEALAHAVAWRDFWAVEAQRLDRAAREAAIEARRAARGAGFLAIDRRRAAEAEARSLDAAAREAAMLAHGWADIALQRAKEV